MEKPFKPCIAEQTSVSFLMAPLEQNTMHALDLSASYRQKLLWFPIICKFLCFKSHPVSLFPLPFYSYEINIILFCIYAHLKGSRITNKGWMCQHWGEKEDRYGVWFLKNHLCKQLCRRVTLLGSCKCKHVGTQHTFHSAESFEEPCKSSNMKYLSRTGSSSNTHRIRIGKFNIPLSYAQFRYDYPLN